MPAITIPDERAARIEAAGEGLNEFAVAVEAQGLRRVFTLDGHFYTVFTPVACTRGRRSKSRPARRGNVSRAEPRSRQKTHDRSD